jgi:signal transduction histidine kinase
VPIDWDHMQAAVVNLLRNASDAIEGQGEVWVATSRHDDEVVIRVTDTGKGIPPEVQDRVFEPYFSTKKAGTGLGLPTTRRIVEEHGGTLGFSSEPGKGTQFAIHLPLVARTGEVGA